MLVPVTATRTSPKTTFGFSPNCSQTPRSAASIASTVQSQAASTPLHRRHDLGGALVPGDSGPRLLVELDRAEQERAERLEVGQRRDLLLRERRDLGDARGLVGERRAALAQEGREPLREVERRQRAQVDPVHPLELLGVEDGGRRVDALEREQADQLVAREQLALGVEMPAHQGEEVDDRLGEVARVAQLLDARRPVALREPLPVGAEEQRQVRERRHRRVQPLVDEHLARRGAEQILAADDVRDAHVGVVDRVHEVVRGHAVGAHDHVVAELRVLEAHLAAHDVGDDALALVGRAQADHRRDSRSLPRGPLRVAESEAAARVDERAARLLGSVALGGELLGRAVAAVCEALREELLGDRMMTRAALALDVGLVRAADIRPLVPLEPDPAQRALDLLDRLGMLARLVGVLDPQHEAPAVVARVEPREQRGAHAAHVQQAGRGRRKARADGACHGFGL